MKSRNLFYLFFFIAFEFSYFCSLSHASLTIPIQNITVKESSSKISSDNRIPLYLTKKSAQIKHKKMRGFLADVSLITEALAEEDADKLKLTTTGLLNRTIPKRKEEKKQGIEPGYRLLRNQFKQEVLLLSNAAMNKDFNEALHSLNRTLDICVSCHSLYKHSIKD